jgi:hypothetical protein
MLLIQRTTRKPTFGWIYRCKLLMISVFAANAAANSPDLLDNNMLTITPTRCVALRQGQTCYLEAHIIWKTSKKGDYCLVNLTTGALNQCWKNKSSGQLLLDFEGSSSNDFALQEESNGNEIALGQIIVAWVFSSSKRNKSNWKLF